MIVARPKTVLVRAGRRSGFGKAGEIRPAILHSCRDNDRAFANSFDIS
jgi:hypothetical protein